jgi:hypothetical protein
MAVTTDTKWDNLHELAGKLNAMTADSARPLEATTEAAYVRTRNGNMPPSGEAKALH